MTSSLNSMTCTEAKYDEFNKNEGDLIIEKHFEKTVHTL